MVKISVLQHQRPELRPGDPAAVSRNLDPLLHPFARPRERIRALNAAKLDRLFAKPFVNSLDGHLDAVEALARQPGSLTTIASASWDGCVCVHNLATQAKILRLPKAHTGKVSGITFCAENRLLSCGVDKNIKIWDLVSNTPLQVFSIKHALNSIDHRGNDNLFATASNVVHIWDQSRSAPIMTINFPTSTETILGARFNLSETSVLASIGSDRTFTLSDIRTGKAERRVVMHMRSNALAWSPIYPTVILLASEDQNLYTFDMRQLASPTQIYKGHVAAVTSCDWSPTGLEFVSGGWDRTLRIWREGQGHSPETYHTKRMQRVSSTIFSADARFVLSGSDDGNVRIWKANASDKLGVITARERAAIEYRRSLVQRWQGDGEIGRISRRRHLPKAVYNASKLKKTMLEAQRVKEERRRKHTRAGEDIPRAERKKIVIVEQQ